MHNAHPMINILLPFMCNKKK